MKKSKLIRVAGCALSVALACSPVVFWSAPAYAESSDIETHNLPIHNWEKDLRWDTSLCIEGPISNDFELTETKDTYFYVGLNGPLDSDIKFSLHSDDGSADDINFVYKKDDTGVASFGPYKLSAGNYVLDAYWDKQSSDSGFWVLFFNGDSDTLSDVNTGVAHSADIAWLVDSGISTGYPDGTFRPYTDVARADMAAFLYRLAGEPAYTAPATSPFKDVTSSTPHYKEICWLAELGISQGWDVSGGKEFRPYATVTRCDMAAFLYRMGPAATCTADFLDCNENTPHYKEICWLANKGVSTGWEVSGGREFRPYSKVTRADMAAFLHRMDYYGLVLPHVVEE